MTNDKLTVRYRTIDIVTPVMIAVAFGVIFLGYGAVYSLLKPVTSVYLPLRASFLASGSCRHFLLAHRS
ncbi:substrate-specific component YkoE of thiamin-regulated ECF transporter [Cutibacterium acnes JCM 18909]|nr:substrate-specific component YkoE of thiamin-regulated ECF transporter [Cutibacterium acnes JCM 18909]